MTFMPGFSGWRDNEYADRLADLESARDEAADRDREDLKLGRDDDR